jgi:predicted ArsR family transcriptional regulator
MKARFTTAEVAQILNVEKEEARHLIKFLEVSEMAKCMGERPSEGRGKSEKVYSFDEGYEKRLCGMLLAAKLTG